MVQIQWSISAVRFSNMIFESLWEQQVHGQCPDHPLRDCRRGRTRRYYDNNGALRDMVQNHILQIAVFVGYGTAAFLAMRDVRSEKIKASFSGSYNTTRRGQPQPLSGPSMPETSAKALQAYREEPNVNPASSTETFCGRQNISR